MGKVFRFKSAASLMIHGGAEVQPCQHAAKSSGPLFLLIQFDRKITLLSLGRESVLLLLLFSVFFTNFKDKKVHA